MIEQRECLTRCRYRGADVAIKKLKKQNMGNQQLEDLAKEAMVMVGLRHPNIRSCFIYYILFNLCFFDSLNILCCLWESVWRDLSSAL